MIANRSKSKRKHSKLLSSENETDCVSIPQMSAIKEEINEHLIILKLFYLTNTIIKYYEQISSIYVAFS